MNSLLNRVTCGDCLRVLPELPDGCVNFVLTDPPYMVSYRDRSNRTVTGDDRADWLRPSFPKSTVCSGLTVFASAFTAGTRPIVSVSLAGGRISARWPPGVCQALCIFRALPALPP
jgi:hypothetical protein